MLCKDYMQILLMWVYDTAPCDLQIYLLWGAWQFP